MWTRRYLTKTSLLFSFAGASAPGAPTVGGSGAARELTAEQLAGTINGQNRSSGGNAPGTRTRRPRRPRRTPSQMSVTSLPEYNKEPGEEELVIFRSVTIEFFFPSSTDRELSGRDMEDATMPAAIVRSSADDDRASMSSQDQSQLSLDSPMPTSTHNMPLLHNNNTEGDCSFQSLTSLGEDRASRSVDIGETSSLLRVESNLGSITPDSRGEAPAYFEVVNLDERLGNPEPSPISQNTSPEPRPSGFRNLLNRMSMAPHANRHKILPCGNPLLEAS